MNLEVGEIMDSCRSSGSGSAGDLTREKVMNMGVTESEFLLMFPANTPTRTDGHNPNTFTLSCGYVPKIEDDY